MNSRKVALVTGGLGFVSEHLVKKLLNEDWYIFLLSRSSPTIKKFENIKNIKQINWVDLENCEFNHINNVQKWIFHTAGLISVPKSIKNPHYIIEVNTSLNLKILKLLSCNKNINYVFFSTDRVFSGNKENVNENTIPHPNDPYGLSKLICEKIGVEYSNYFGNNIIIVRCSSLYGFNQKPYQLISSIIKKYFDGITLQKISNFDAIRNILYIEDFIDGIFKIINLKNSRNNIETFHFSGFDYSIKDITNLIKIKINENYKNNINFEKDENRLYNQDILYNKFESTITQNKLNWMPITNLNKGINKIFELYKNKGN